MKANLTREQLGLKSLRYGSEASLSLSTGLKYHIRGQTDQYSACLSFFLFLAGLSWSPSLCPNDTVGARAFTFYFDHFANEGLVLKMRAGKE